MQSCASRSVRGPRRTALSRMTSVATPAGLGSLYLIAVLAEQSPATLGERAEASRKLSPVDVPSHSPAAVGEAVAGAVWDALSGGCA